MADAIDPVVVSHLRVASTHLRSALAEAHRWAGLRDLALLECCDAGATHYDIAVMLGVSDEAARSLITRCRARARQLGEEPA